MCELQGFHVFLPSSAKAGTLICKIKFLSCLIASIVKVSVVGGNAAEGHRLPQGLPFPSGSVGSGAALPWKRDMQVQMGNRSFWIRFLWKKSHGVIQEHFLNLVSKYLLAAFQQSWGWEKSCLEPAASPCVLQLQVLH